MKTIRFFNIEALYRFDIGRDTWSWRQPPRMDSLTDGISYKKMEIKDVTASDDLGKRYRWIKINPILGLVVKKK
jgi:hypothetical protein